MWMRKTMKKENEIGTIRKVQDRRSQKESVLSRQTTLLKGLAHSLITLHPHISQLFWHQYLPQPFLLCCLCCLCFNRLFPTTPQQFVEKRTTTGFWQIVFTPKPWSSPSELKDLSICMSPSRHAGQEPPWEVPRPRADLERNLAQSRRSSKTHSCLCCDFSYTLCNNEIEQEWDDPFVRLPWQCVTDCRTLLHAALLLGYCGLTVL